MVRKAENVLGYDGTVCLTLLLDSASNFISESGVFDKGAFIAVFDGITAEKIKAEMARTNGQSPELAFESLMKQSAKR